jgi:tetraacyldisaccharide 4'-kinase
MKTVLLLFSFAYRFGSQLKNFLYNRKILTTKNAPFPIVSVGNIAFGGSEKTPLVIELLAILQEQGYRPAMISRGYRGRWEKKGGILSDGKNMLGTWEDSGDESFLVAQNLPQVGIFVGKDRWESCQKAHRLGFDVGVLDDGFQHLRLHRDLDIVLHNPEKKMLLREPISSLKRADILLINSRDKIKKKISSLEKTTFFYSVQSQSFYQLGEREEVKAKSLKRKKVIAFCGIARPERFLSLLKSEGIAPLSFITFPDHHPFPPSSIEKILDSCESSGAEAVIMTEKDAVKLASRLPFKSYPAFYLKIGLKLEETFFTFFLSLLQDKDQQAR